MQPPQKKRFYKMFISYRLWTFDEKYFDDKHRRNAGDICWLLKF